MFCFSNIYRRTKATALIIITSIALPAAAQDFGYPSEKAFYKAHWNEVVQDQDSEQYYDNLQYLLFDYDNDGAAELYLWFNQYEQYLYSARNGKVVRVSDNSRETEDDFSIQNFEPHFMAPYELLFDKSVPDFEAMEQQVYDKWDIPGIWFGMHPKVEGTFNIKSVARAICNFDCPFLSEALDGFANGRCPYDNVEEFIVDPVNGFARLYSLADWVANNVELCYWNMKGGEKLVALNYHLSDKFNDEVESFQQTLFMKYDPATKRLNPIVAPIEGYNFKGEYNFKLPRKGKNITLIGVDHETLTWTGKGFKYK